MTAVSADTLGLGERALGIAIEEVYPIKTSATVYVGALANFTTLGRVTDAAAAASVRFAGLVVAIINDSGTILTAGTGNAGGTIKAKIRYNHEVLLNVKTATRTYANIGKTVTVADNVTVGGTGVGTAGVRVAVGQLVQAGTATAIGAFTTGWVKLRHFGDAAAT